MARQRKAKRKKEEASPPAKAKRPAFVLPEENYENIFEWGGRLRQYVIRDVLASPPGPETWFIADQFESMADGDEKLQRALIRARKANYSKDAAADIEGHLTRIFQDVYLVEYVRRFLGILPKIIRYFMAKDAWMQCYPEHFCDDPDESTSLDNVASDEARPV